MARDLNVSLQSMTIHAGTSFLGPLQIHSEMFLGQSQGGVAVAEGKYRKRRYGRTKEKVSYAKKDQ